MLRVRVILASVSLLLGCQILSAQVTSGEISGVVKDETGAVLPGVSISIQNQETGITRVLVTDNGGRYRAPNLGLGNYTVQAEIQGFQSASRTGIRLTLEREAVVDFTLRVGAVEETVTVTGEAPLIETTSSAVSALVDDKKIRDLPLNGRSFEQLATLQPLVASVTRAARINYSNRKTNKISIQGARPDQNAFLLDGTDVVDARGNTPGGVGGTFLGVETVAEFRVETSSYSAEYGRAAGGVINAVTKSGTNQFHGSVYEFFRNSALDAKNFFDQLEKPIPPFKRNQFGFTLGGPIARNRTFFFGSYEGLRERLGLTQRAVVPSADARRGFLPNPTTGQLEFVGVHPNVKPYLDLYPLPNGRDFGDGTAERSVGTSQPTDENYFVIRPDHNFSTNHSIFGRYTFDDSNQNLRGQLPEFSELQGSRNQYLTLQLNSVISPTLLNTARFGLNRSFTSSELDIQIHIPLELGWFPGEPLFSAGGQLAVEGGITDLADRGAQLPNNVAFNLFEWSDDVNYVKGIHSFKAGALIKRVQFNTQQGRANRYRFGGIRNFLLNQSARFSGNQPGADRIRGFRQIYWGHYVQDSVQLPHNLNLNLGLRYELITGPSEVNGKCANLDDVMDPAPRVGCPLFETFTKQFAPRVGLAWDPRGNGKTSLRAGFGLFYDLYFSKAWDSAGTGSPPFAVDVDIRNAPFPNISEVLGGAAGVPTPSLRAVRVAETPYIMQYNLSYEQELLLGTVLTLGYAGSRGVHLNRSFDANVAIPLIQSDGRKFFPPGSRKRNPAFSDNLTLASDANSYFNAFLLSVKKGFSGGLQFQVSYTWSRAIDESSNTQVREVARNSTGETMDGYNLRADRGPSNFNVSHNFVANYTYELPLARGLSGLTRALLGGWQLNGIVSLASGTPFTPGNQFDRANQQTGTNRNDRPNLVGKSNNPIEGTTAGCTGVAPGQKLGGPDLYFDPCFFDLQPVGYFGNLGRNTVIGPGLANFDFSLVKVSALGENKSLQFRAEFFNLLNRPNFGLPAVFLFQSNTARIGSAGRISEPSTTSRQVQFGLKFYF